MDRLSSADRFIGNDSGPGHLAALLGVPTFTVGPQLPEVFSPRHPNAEFIEGAPCRYKPCRDYCRFSEPLCLTALDVETVRKRVIPWLNR
jgi:heptosyltransferase-2